MTDINTAGAAYDIIADRGTACVLKLEFHARDMSAATFTGEVRQNPNEADDVDPLASFVFTPVLVAVEAGETVSRLMAVIDEAAMAALPTAGEAGEAAELCYDIHAAAPARKKVCGGKFIVEGAVTND